MLPCSRSTRSQVRLGEERQMTRVRFGPGSICQAPKEGMVFWRVVRRWFADCIWFFIFEILSE